MRCRRSCVARSRPTRGPQLWCRAGRRSNEAPRAASPERPPPRRDPGPSLATQNRRTADPWCSRTDSNGSTGETRRRVIGNRVAFRAILTSTRIDARVTRNVRRVSAGVRNQRRSRILDPHLTNPCPRSVSPPDRPPQRTSAILAPAQERSEPPLSWTIAGFCGNIYTAPPDRCAVCGSTIGDAAPRPTAAATDADALAARAATDADRRPVTAHGLRA